MMNKIVLTTDSGVCPLKRDNSVVIPARIVENGEKSFPDDGKVTTREIIDNAKRGVKYKTSSPLLGDYYDAFSHILEEGKDIIHLSMGSGISMGSVNSATLVAEDLLEEYSNKVYVIDSLTGATGGTMLYELAYNMITKENSPAHEIVQKLNQLKTRIKTSFYVPDISGFLSSGRDKTSSHIKEGILSQTSKLARMASLKFRVDFHENGDLFLKKIFRSDDEFGMEKMVRSIVNDKTIENYSSDLAVIGSIYQKDVDMDKIIKYLASFDYFKKIINHNIGPIIAPYGCPDLCGLSLIKKRKL